jgi:hypothetical protein
MGFTGCLDEIYDLSYNHSLQITSVIQEITSDQVRNAARKYLTPQTATISIVHNTELSEEKVRAAWNGVHRLPRSQNEGFLSAAV